MLTIASQLEFSLCKDANQATTTYDHTRRYAACDDASLLLTQKSGMTQRGIAVE
jgi:hypothetical protein